MTLETETAAYVDGELSPAEAHVFETRMAADADLAAEVAAQQALRARLRAAYDPVADEAPPEALLELIRRGARAEVLPFAPRRPAALPAWAAMAASLVVGVGFGLAWTHARAPSLSQASDGALVASGSLSHALDRQLATEVGPIKVAMTFRDSRGRLCRTFESTPDRLAGVACRDTDRWAAQLTTAYSPAPAGGAYRQAGSGLPAPVLAAVDAMIAGRPLDASEEQAARARDWTPSIR